MARPIEFDTGAARDSAMLLFWRKGYLASSLPELLEEMGISRGSFYAAFRDKRSLFVECLDLFAERTHEMLARVRRRADAHIAALVPNARGAERALGAGVDEMVCFISARNSSSRGPLAKCSPPNW